MAYPVDRYKVFSNISATTATFDLRGGLYGITASASWGGGTVTLQKLAADGASYVTALTAFSASGYATVNLVEGTYRVAVATSTAVYVEIKAVQTSDA